MDNTPVVDKNSADYVVEPWSRTRMWLYTLHCEWLAKVVGLWWRLGLSGETGSIPRTGPLLVTANHSCFLDPWLISMALSRQIRWLMTENWYYRSRLSEFLFRSYATIPVRAKDPSTTLGRVRQSLEHGDAVGIFPEGRISSDGQIQRFRSGLARIAAVTGAPVVPCGIRGAFESLPRTSRFPKPTRVTIHVGKPIRFEGAPLDRDPLPSEIRTFNRILRAETFRLAGKEEASGKAGSKPLAS